MNTALIYSAQYGEQLDQPQHFLQVTITTVLWTTVYDVDGIYTDVIGFDDNEDDPEIGRTFIASTREDDLSPLPSWVPLPPDGWDAPIRALAQMGDAS